MGLALTASPWFVKGASFQPAQTLRTLSQDSPCLTKVTIILENVGGEMGLWGQ